MYGRYPGKVGYGVLCTTVSIEITERALDLRIVRVKQLYDLLDSESVKRTLPMREVLLDGFTEGEDMKRQRQVYPTSEIAHLWAHKTQESARNAQGNFYFEGDTIYSYGSHFPIARHISRKNKPDAILFTTRTYSSTTAKHIWDVRRAIPYGALVFHVPDPEAESPKDGLDHYRKQLKTLEQTARKSKGLMLDRLSNLSEEIREANRYADYFGLKTRFEHPADWDELHVKAREFNKHHLQAQARKDEARRIERQKCMELQRASAQERLEAWLNGQNAGYLGYLDKVYLRVSGAEIETTMGARFPVEHAKRAIPLIRKCKQEHREFQRNGHTVHLGHYSLDRIDTEGNVTAGCHHVEYSEVERIAAQLGV